MSETIIKMPIPYEPKKQNRWVVKFKEPFNNIKEWCVAKTTRPKIVDNNWEDIEITLRDPISPSTSQAVMDGLRATNNKIIPISYDLEILDPTGVTVEKWAIEAIVKEVDFGELNYSNDDLIHIKMILEPTNVILEY